MADVTTPASAADSDSDSRRMAPGKSIDPLSELPAHFLRVTPQVFVGGEPSVEQLRRLAEQGIRTIVSVDGAKTKANAAHQLGMRYVHIPLSYDGVKEAAGKSLAKVARSAEHAVYVHCHHGQHRGPAAAAILCIAMGDLDRAQAMKLLETAGTGKQYTGLWRDVRRYVPPTVDAVLPELVSQATVASFPRSMVSINTAFENLAQIRKAEWGTLPQHPDITLAHQATLLAEGFREAVRFSDQAKAQDDAFRHEMQRASAMAKQFQRYVQIRQTGSPKAPAFKTASPETASPKAGSVETVWLQLKRSCTQCHESHRN